MEIYTITADPMDMTESPELYWQTYLTEDEAWEYILKCHNEVFSNDPENQVTKDELDKMLDGNDEVELGGISYIVQAVGLPVS